jgi:HK97 family phage major capsid protein
MAPAKLGVITVISQELVNTSNPAALSVIRDDMVRGTANTIDTLFISATAASAPAPAGILNGVTGNTASTATLDLDKAIADLKGMADDLVGADVPGPYVWIMNSAQHNSLLYMTDTVAGGFAFRNELASGTLMGHRVVVSNNVAAATVILVAESQILWATGRAPEITLSNEATIHLDTAPDSNLSGATGGEVTSMFQTDSVASKLITSLTWARRHDEAVSYVTSVGW